MSLITSLVTPNRYGYSFIDPGMSLQTLCLICDKGNSIESAQLNYVMLNGEEFRPQNWPLIISSFPKTIHLVITSQELRSSHLNLSEIYQAGHSITLTVVGTYTPKQPDSGWDLFAPSTEIQVEPAFGEAIWFKDRYGETINQGLWKEPYNIQIQIGSNESISKNVHLIVTERTQVQTQ